METMTAAEDSIAAPPKSRLDLIRTWSGVISGISLGIAFMADIRALPELLVVRVVAGGAIMLTVMKCWSLSAHWIAEKLRFSPGQAERYFRFDTVAAAPALLMVLFAFGARFAAPQVACLILVMIAARAAALFVAVAREQRDELFTSNGWLAFLFLISGFAALIYQIVWERALFAAFGVNIESITIVISLFMFGLGIGSLVGGVIARRFPGRAPLLFLVCELCIGAFGLVSLPLIGIVARATLHSSLPVISASILALLCIPTLFMGATLPILVTHLYRHYRNLGQSVGILYSINTVGSALACFLTADLLFVFGGEHTAIIVAAACNFVVGILVSRYARKTARGDEDPSLMAEGGSPRSYAGDPRVSARVHHGKETARWLVILFFAAATGYISLSQEIVWMRIIGFISRGVPTVFAHVLGCFLIGVAGGALLGEKWCARNFAVNDRRPIRFVGAMLLASAGFYYLSTAALAEWMTRDADTAQYAIYGIVAVTSFLLGGVFTVLCHDGARASEAAGVTVSRIYLANILGCTLGPILSGFVFMQFIAIDRIILYLGVGTALLGGIALMLGTEFSRTIHVGSASSLRIYWRAVVLDRRYQARHGGRGRPPSREFPSSSRTSSRPPTRSAHSADPTRFKVRGRELVGPLVAVFTAAAMFVVHPAAYRDFLAKLQSAESYRPNRYSAIVETRSGIITVETSPATGDIIYGGGKYDGKFNIDPVLDSNLIFRCYMIAGLHPGPSEVLEIGLSSGSWARVMADYTPIRHLTSVEINSGYIDILRKHADRYPLQASILNDPKVSIAIDDGRRWLNRNPSRMFDLMVQNTSYHWRGEVTNLLSVEYLQLCKRRLNPGGVVYCNTTCSDDIPYTAAHVFQHIVRIGGFIAASDSPFDLNANQIGENLMRFVQSGHPIFDSPDANDAAALRRKLRELVNTPLLDIAPEIRRRKDLWLITDDNMATEFKRLPSDEDSGIDRTQWWDGDRHWMNLFRWK